MRPMRTLLSLAALWIAATVWAQQPHDQASYDLWKINTYNVPPPASGPPVLTLGQMQRDTPPSLQRGGSTTCDCWVQPDASYTTINNSSQWNASGFHNADDGSHGPIVLPFQFYLYGQLFNTAYININGNVSFGTWYGTFSSTGFPIANFSMVAPFWADVDLRGPGVGNNIVQYKVTPTAFYVNWTNVGYYSMQTDKVNTFQLIITDGNDPVVPNGANVSFCYQDMQWTTGSASGGVNGFGGTSASVGANHGNGVDYIQFGRFNGPGTQYFGPFALNSQVSWLDDQYFTFSTDVTTANVPPVITGQSVCDSIILCVGQTSTLEVIFLSPEPNQVTTCNAFSTTLSNVNILSNTPGLSATIVVEITPTPADVGYHVLTIEGTDNGQPVMTSTLNIVVWVQQGATISPGSLDVCSNDPPLNMLSLLGGNPPSGGTWTDPNGNATTGTFTPGTSIDGPYLYILGAGGNCASSGTVTMTTQQAVNAGLDMTMAYCSNDGPDDLFLNLNGGPMTGGYWLYPNGTSFGGTLYPGTDPAGDYRYIVPGTAPCTNDTATVTVSIPQAVNAGLDATIDLCEDAVPLIMVGALGGTPQLTGTWVDPNGQPFGGTFLAATDAPGTYTYTVVAVAPCPTLSADLTIGVDPAPRAGNDAVLDICFDGPVTNLFPLLGGGPNTGGAWLDPFMLAHAPVLDPANDPSGTYTYVAYGQLTCAHLTDSARVEVTVRPLPVVTFEVDPPAGCHPLDVVFTNTTDSLYIGTSCIWDLGDGTVLNDCVGPAHLYTDPNIYTVTLTITSPYGCVGQLIKPNTVIVEPAPLATFSWAPDPGTEGLAHLYFAADDPQAVQWTWTFEGTDTATTQFVYHQFPDVFGGDYEVCLAVADRFGCVDTLCKVATIIVPSVFIPNAFTPDGNGLNDEFKPALADMVPEDHEMEVYDRWGQLIFASKNIEDGWNGRYQNTGEVLPEGVYIWRLVGRPIFSADKKEWVGHVTLLK